MVLIDTHWEGVYFVNIAVYDEDESVLKKIRCYFKRHDAVGENKSIDYFANVEDMLISLKDRAYDIFLLGTGIKGIRGAGYVVYIRSRNNKIISFAQFREELSEAWNIYSDDDEYYIGYFNRDKVVLKINEIYYLESVQRETYVWLNGIKYRVNGSLEQEEKKLPTYLFARISQGELVNLRYVDRIEKECVYLSNGSIKYASIRRALQAMEKWKFYRIYYKICHNSTKLLS